MSVRPSASSSLLLAEAKNWKLTRVPAWGEGEGWGEAEAEAEAEGEG